MNWEKLWLEQWELFAPNFREGRAHIELGPELTLQLLPGGGFGDLSHPTTRLMLHHLKPLAPGATVIDIGCGSGILSLASSLLGAKSVYGIDIDPVAVAHSCKNLSLNTQCRAVHFSEKLPSLTARGPLLILMNMIPTEQLHAWEAQKKIHGLPKRILTSGVLKEFKKSYLEWAFSLGWRLVAIYEDSEWLLFEFTS